ncbi:sigma-70 family RNA polymerase sigma factor [Actinotalea soli]|uniref:sigma-70 family RNA polymerase sigma factor n=1 Tax=Actinotalea soli TaxID=2819234 RepID=UPI0027DE5844|nr:sigma-70 family RNA polymerase sigma factor [Actinotalea soli]
MPIEPELVRDSVADDLALARTGDDAAFTRLVHPLRRELHAHCYRMLGSTHDADDALQEALLRAWRALPRFEGRSSLRTWLYRVTTRTCLDAVAARGRRALPMDLTSPSHDAVVGDTPLTEVAWLGPYSDVGMEGGASSPAARYEQREAVELAFVAALQHLPGNQRAVLLLVEVLGFSAREIADLMDTTTASVTSALQRARRLIDQKVPAGAQQQTLQQLGDVGRRDVVERFMSAMEAGDAGALVALLTEDVTWSMPPLPHWYRGQEAVMNFARALPLSTCGQWRHLPTTANGQLAVVSYLSPDGGPFEAWSINVLTISGERICQVTSFLGREHVEAFGLPVTFPEE